MLCYRGLLCPGRLFFFRGLRVSTGKISRSAQPLLTCGRGESSGQQSSLFFPQRLVSRYLETGTRRDRGRSTKQMLSVFDRGRKGCLPPIRASR